jgi:hypothetical protein
MTSQIVIARSVATRQSMHPEGMDRHAALAMTKVRVVNSGKINEKNQY